MGEFLLGRIDEPALFEAAASGDAGKESGQRCEAFFYAGMKRLLAGDKPTASGYFEKCVATKYTDFIEYRAAKAELKALK